MTIPVCLIRKTIYMQPSTQTAMLQMPGYRPIEYRLVIDIPETLRNKIQHVRDVFSRECRIARPLSTRPNLSLVSFTQYAMMEERIMHRLHMIAMGTAPFRVELKDFGSFPIHTVFINVITKEPIQNLVKQIRADGHKLMKFDEEHKPNFTSEPHVIIASKLLPWQYEKGSLKLHHSSFTGRFNVDAMFLLKRTLGTKNWQIARRFDLENMPVSTTQGALF